MPYSIVLIQYYYYLFCFPNCSTLGIGTPFIWLLYTSIHFHPFNSIAFFSDITRYSRLILYFPCLSPGINFFSKDPWGLFYWKMLFQNQIWMLGMLIATEVFTAPKPYQRMARGNTGMCVNVCPPIHPYTDT